MKEKSGLEINSLKWKKLLEIQKDTEYEKTGQEEPIVLERFLKVVKNFAKPEDKILEIGATLREQERLKELGFLNLISINLEGTKEILQMDMHNLQFERESFDIVIAKNTVEHSFIPWLLFLEIRSVLKTGGLFIFTLQNYHPWNRLFEHPFLVQEDYIQSLERFFGFKTIYRKDYQSQVVLVWEKLENWKAIKWPNKKFDPKEFVKEWERIFH